MDIKDLAVGEKTIIDRDGKQIEITVISKEVLENGCLEIRVNENEVK